ncbi:hypothetical protein CENTIMANUS_00275 [Klebsiella phage vB_KpM_Centimanus]
MSDDFLSVLMREIAAGTITEREAARTLMRLVLNKENKPLIENLLISLCNEVYPPRLLMALVRSTYMSNKRYVNWDYALNYGKKHHPDLFVGLKK